MYTVYLRYQIKRGRFLLKKKLRSKIGGKFQSGRISVNARFLTDAALRHAFCIIMRDWCNAKAREDIRDSLTGRVSSIEVVRHVVDLLRREHPEDRRSLMLPLCLSRMLLHMVTFVFAGRLTKPLNPHRFPRCLPQKTPLERVIPRKCTWIFKSIHVISFLKRKIFQIQDF